MKKGVVEGIRSAGKRSRYLVAQEDRCDAAPSEKRFGEAHPRGRGVHYHWRVLPCGQAQVQPNETGNVGKLLGSLLL